MKNLMFIMLALVIGATGVQAQDQAKAKSILDKLKAKYDRYLALEIGVGLTIEVPESDPEVLDGKMVQSGDKYRIEMGDNIIISDGESIWTVMKDNDVVQWSDVEEMEEGSDAMMSPKDLLRMYENGEFSYALTNEAREDGEVIQQIEFKPKDEDSEYFKMRLTVNKDDESIKRIKVFSRDGSRYTLEVKRIRANKIYDSSYFEYDKSICPTCEIEDIRL